MKNLFNIIIIGTLASVVSAKSYAVVYAEANIGYSMVANDKIDSKENTTPNSYGYNINLGFDGLIPFVSAEVGLIRFAAPTFDNQRYNFTGYNVALRVNTPQLYDMNLFAKASLGYLDTDIDITGDIVGKFTPMYALGLQYNIITGLYIQTMYQQYQSQKQFPSASLYSFGIGWGF